MNNSNFSYFVGVDISKDSFTAAVKSNSSFTINSFKQSCQDFQKFINFINSHSTDPNSILIAMESTSTYYLPLLNFLKSFNFNISIINPSQIRNFSKIFLNPTKTDKIDAKTIAHFASLFAQNPSNPLQNSLFEFKIISRQYEFITSLIQRVKNDIKRITFITFPEIQSHFNIFSNSFLNILVNFPSAYSVKENITGFESAFSSIVHKKVKFKASDIIQLASNSIGINSNVFNEILKGLIKILIFLKNIKKELKKSIERRVEEIENNDVKIITTIKGIGKMSASQFLAEIGDIRRFANKKKVVSYIGAAPVIKQSGKYKAEIHISKKGNRHARRLLYLMATNVIMYEEKFKKYYERMRSKGKTHKEAVIAVGNKLVHHIYSMIIHNRPFSQNYS